MVYMPENLRPRDPDQPKTPPPVPAHAVPFKATAADMNAAKAEASRHLHDAIVAARAGDREARDAALARHRVAYERAADLTRLLPALAAQANAAPKEEVTR